MTACCQCPHYESEHEETAAGSRFGGRCRARYYTSRVYETCPCPGYEPVEDDDD